MALGGWTRQREQKRSEITTARQNYAGQYAMLSQARQRAHALHDDIIQWQAQNPADADRLERLRQPVGAACRELDRVWASLSKVPKILMEIETAETALEQEHPPT